MLINLPTRLLWVVVFVSAMACSSTSDKTTDAGAADAVVDPGAVDSASSDTGAVDAGASDAGPGDAGTADKWWKCSTWESETGSPAVRNKSCETNYDDGKYGCKAPWYGDKQDGTSFTCNLCRGGDPLVQARWRAVDFNTEDPSKPLSGDHKEVLTIDGNTWHLRAEHTDKGVVHKVKVDGWYWCSDAAEIKSASNVFHATAKEGSDFFGWFAPDVFTGLFLTKGKDQLAWSYNEGFETKKAGDALYCRIGSTIKGQPCTDPFK